ncbi:MAG: hypothetical protein NTX03_15325 [Bacteroidetes bacterium]|nr:hypothetical protein [Bacteroidota bacterium]
MTKKIQDLEFNKNEDENRLLLKDVEKELAKIAKGGGEKAAAKQKEKGKPKLVGI